MNSSLALLTTSTSMELFVKQYNLVQPPQHGLSTGASECVVLMSVQSQVPGVVPCGCEGLAQIQLHRSYLYTANAQEHHLT